MNAVDIFNNSRCMRAIKAEFANFEDFRTLAYTLGFINYKEFVQEHERIYVMLRRWCHQTPKTFDDLRDVLRSMRKYDLVTTLETIIVKIRPVYPTFNRGEMAELHENIYAMMTPDDIRNVLSNAGVSSDVIDKLIARGSCSEFWSALNLYVGLSSTRLDAKMFASAEKIYEFITEINKPTLA